MPEPPANRSGRLSLWLLVALLATGSALPWLLNRRSSISAEESPEASPGPAAADPAPVDEFPTFARDVAPLVYGNCTVCHYEGGSAPFAFGSYEDVAKRAKQIAIVTGDRYMPPWKPVGEHGRFEGDRRLSDAEIRTFALWAAAGAPRGDPSEEPPAPAIPTGFRLGTPDVVFRLDEPAVVPAEGRDAWLTQVVDPGLDEDRWVAAIECIPSNLQVLHHFQILADPKGVTKDKPPRVMMVGGENLAAGGNLFGEELYEDYVTSWLPGVTPSYLPQGVPMLLGKDTPLVIEAHFRTTGKVEECQLEYGLYFADEPPERLPGVVLLNGCAINIPPGVPDYPLNQALELPVDMRVSAVSAHAHYVAKRVECWAILPDDSVVSLLEIDDWDLDWQDVYRYEEPFLLPAGTRIEASYVYDNSADNPRNPFSPPHRILTGIRAKDEMAITFVFGTVATLEDQETLKHHVNRAWKDVGLLSMRPSAVWHSIVGLFDEDGDHSLGPEEDARATEFVDGLPENYLVRAFDQDADNELDDEERSYADRMVRSWYGPLEERWEPPR